MFTWLKANQAFNRTSAHPLDTRVRIAHSRDDLIAIQSERTKAVIIPAPLSHEIETELKALRNRVKRGRHVEKGPIVTSYNRGMIWTDKFISESNPLKYSLHMLTHMASLLTAFRMATGQLETRTAGNGVPVETLNIQATCEASFRDELDPQKQGHTVPHSNKNVDRLLCTYSEDENAGITWLPGTFSFQEERALQETYLQSANPDSILKQHNAQTLKPGHILMVKGTAEGRGRDQLLVHKITRPQSGVPSFTASLQTI